MRRAKGPKSVTSGKTDLGREAATAMPRGEGDEEGEETAANGEQLWHGPRH